MAASITAPVIVQDIQAWLMLRWDSLLSLDIPSTIKRALSALFPPSTYEGILIDISSANVDFALNEIPSASVGVSVGFDARNTAAVSIIHRLSRYLKLFLSASIWVSIRRTYSEGAAFKNHYWPATPFRIFDGYIVGASPRRTTQGEDYTLQMTHWLSNLNFSSALSRTSSPQNPGQISFNPAFPDTQASGSAGKNVNGSYMTMLQTILNDVTIFKDMWGNTVKSAALPTLTPPELKGGEVDQFIENSGSEAGKGHGIKDWFSDLCNRDRINWQLFPAGLCGNSVTSPGAAKNVEAMSALRRFEPLSGGYSDGVPLALRKELGTASIANQISSAFAHNMPMALANSTLWDKLVGEFGSEFLFAVVPQVEKALVVPFNPGLRSVWTTIPASELEVFEQSIHIPRPLRGIGMFIGREMQSGGGASLQKQVKINTIGAYYENPSRRNGMIVFKRAPMWLSTVILPHLDIAGGMDTIISTTMALAHKAAVGLNLIEPKDRIEAMKPVWCQYARALYGQEILRGRSAKLSGRLRFDIAPGSMIRVEEPMEPFVMQKMGLTTAPHIYGQVVRVSVMINAEAQKAGTAIQLGFVRDEAENTDDAYSNTGHPIWAKNWIGAPLVNHKEFYLGTARNI